MNDSFWKGWWLGSAAALVLWTVLDYITGAF